MAAEDTSSVKGSSAETTMILVYALSAFVAGAGILVDGRNEVTFFGELLLAAGGALLIAFFAVWSGRAWIWPAGTIAFAAVWTLRDVPSGGVSGSEAARSATVIGLLVAAALAVMLWDRRKKRRGSASNETA